MLCHTLKNVKGKTVSDASARNKVKSSKYGEDSILQKSDLLFFFQFFQLYLLGSLVYLNACRESVLSLLSQKKLFENEL